MFFKNIVNIDYVCLGNQQKEFLFLLTLPMTFEVVAGRQMPDLATWWGPLGPCLTRVLLMRTVYGEQRL